MIRIILLSCLLIITGFLTSCGSSNVPEVKAKAAETWRQAGFEIVGYEGYTSDHCWFNYGCGHVWHTVKRIPDNGIIYHGYIEKWAVSTTSTASRRSTQSSLKNNGVQVGFLEI
jgi:hypothetical protein